jgi:hypothetical protein
MSRRASFQLTAIQLPSILLLAILLVATLSVAPMRVFGATERLYLKDGSFQTVREYEVKADRVRYYSTERSDWEEIPLELVDLNRTRQETADRVSENAAEVKAEAEERAAEKLAVKQVASIPTDPGVFYIASDDKLETLAKAEVRIVSNKKRSVLKVLSPIPIVPGKSTVELDGAQAARKISGSRPEFYFRLSAEERFEIIKLMPKKESRVAENLSILVLKGEKMVDEQIVPVDSFKKQEADQLYRIWPQKPLDPGEYALIQFTEGKMSPQIWDFSIVSK